MTIPGCKSYTSLSNFAVTVFPVLLHSPLGEHDLPWRGISTRPVSQSLGWNSPKRTREETRRPFVLQRDYLSIPSVAFHTGTHTHAHRLAYICRHTHAPCTTRNEAGIVAVAYSEHTTNTLRFITETQNLESKRIATVSNASSRDPWREAARLSKNTLALIATRSRSIESPNTHGSYDTTGRTVTGKSSPVYKCG